MRIQRLRWSLWATGIGLCAGAVAMLGWAAFWPCTLEHSRTPNLEKSPQTTSDATDPQLRHIDLQQFAALWSKHLRAPLNQSSAQPSAESADSPIDAERILSVTLRGTMIEDDHSVAVFSTPQSAIELRGIGELVGEVGDEAELVEIHRDLVVLRYQGKLVNLAFPEEESP